MVLISSWVARIYVDLRLFNFRVCHMCEFYTIQQVNLDSHLKLRHSLSKNNLLRRAPSIARDTELFLPSTNISHDTLCAGFASYPIGTQDSAMGRGAMNSEYLFSETGLGNDHSAAFHQAVCGRNSQGQTGFASPNLRRVPSRATASFLQPYDNASSFQHLTLGYQFPFAIPTWNHTQQSMFPRGQQRPPPNFGMQSFNECFGDNAPAHGECCFPSLILPSLWGSHTQWNVMNDASSFHF